MILCNVEVHAALDSGRLAITPEPAPRFHAAGVDCPYDTHTVDLRLGDELSVPDSGNYAVDYTQGGAISDDIARHSTKYKLTESQPYKLERNKFVLGITYESIHLPIKDGCESCLAARIEGKSSRARSGLLIHFTAPTVHPGWDGPLVLEIINLGASPILLTPLMYIAQLIVEEVRGCPSRTPPSAFQGQRRPDGTR